MIFLGYYRSDPLSTTFLHGTQQLHGRMRMRMGMGMGWDGTGWDGDGYECEHEYDFDEDDCGYDCISCISCISSLALILILISILILILALVLIYHPRDLLTTCMVQVQRFIKYLDSTPRYNWMFILFTCGEIVQAEVKHI